LRNLPMLLYQNYAEAVINLAVNREYANAISSIRIQQKSTESHIFHKTNTHTHMNLAGPYSS
jgi:hypothetical protein